MPERPANSTPSTPDDEKRSEPSESGVGLAPLAGRLFRRTTDLVAISIAAIGLLIVGGYLAEWWTAEPTARRTGKMVSKVAGSPFTFGHGGSGVTLDLGDSPFTLTRKRIAGPRGDARAGLLDHVRQQLVSAPIAAVEPPGPAEQKLLRELEKQQPIEAPSAGARLYYFDRPLPTAIGTRRLASRHAAGDSAPKVDNQLQAGADASAAHSRRVVCWGMGFPGEGESWTLFALHSSRRPGAHAQRVNGNENKPFELRLPEDASRIMSIREETGRTLIAFSGPGPGEAWVHFFDAWLQQRHWTAAGWRDTPVGYSAHYQRNETGEPASLGIHLRRSESGSWHGLASIERGAMNRADGPTQ